MKEEVLYIDNNEYQTSIPQSPDPDPDPKPSIPQTIKDTPLVNLDSDPDNYNLPPSPSIYKQQGQGYDSEQEDTPVELGPPMVSFLSKVHQILAIPDLTETPYHLRSKVKARYVKEARDIISKPYLLQAKKPFIVTNSILETIHASEAPFSSINGSFPLKELYVQCPQFRQVISNWEKALESKTDHIHFLDDNMAHLVTKVIVNIQKSRIKAVLDFGAPDTVVSSKLMQRLKLAPDVGYCKIYGTAGSHTTKAIGGYMALL